MIDNQEKVHTQLHKFDKIVCKDINNISFTNIYNHAIDIEFTYGSQRAYINLDIISANKEQYTEQTLIEYLRNNGFYLTSKYYPCVGSTNTGSAGSSQTISFIGLGVAMNAYGGYELLANGERDTFTIADSTINITRSNINVSFTPATKGIKDVVIPIYNSSD